MEKYRTIVRHPNYEISDYGNVRNKRNGLVRKPTNRRGYLKVRLGNKDESIHRLVAETFLGVPDGDMQVNHIDGNKMNNILNNLEWVTPSYNVKHAYANGLKNHSGGLPPDTVYDETDDVYYESIAECARSIGGTRQGLMYALKHSGKYKNHIYHYGGGIYERV